MHENSLQYSQFRTFAFNIVRCAKLLSRRKTKTNCGRNKQVLGRSIDERPEIANQKSEIGHWEIDTVV